MRTINRKVRVKITPSLATEYVEREVYPFIIGPGDYDLTTEQVDDMVDDAKYQIDPLMEIEHEPHVKRAYRFLINQCQVSV
jgi:hypothetical protein